MKHMLVLFLVVLCSTVCMAEPGEVKLGALIKIDNSIGTDNTSDLELVEFVNFKYEDADLFSLNLGGSYKDESLGVALLVDANGVFKFAEDLSWFPEFLKFEALDFEAGLYVSRQFDDQSWDVGVCSTLFSHKF